MTGFAQTGVSQTPGCAFFKTTFSPQHTVNNETFTYIIRGDVFGTTLATWIQAVRILYRLQVSASPATATFPRSSSPPPSGCTS